MEVDRVGGRRRGFRSARIGALLLCAGVRLFAADLVEVPRLVDFEDATAEGAVRRACADGREDLRDFLAARGLPFDAAALTEQGRRVCHVFYEPSLPGFRASPEDERITGLHVSVDPLSFIVRRKPIGDSLDAAKAVLSRLPRAIDVTVSVGGGFAERYWPEAGEYHFAGMPHAFRYRASGSEITHPWAQDQMKAGTARGAVRVMVPRRLYEGRGADGDLFSPLLDRFDEDVYFRSKLSWEGGDIQFARKPGDPRKLILFHGSAALDYWGRALTPAEYSYVLRAEFGADESVDLSAIGPHTDYLVSFLPGSNIALVSQPARRDPALLRAATAALRDLYEDRASPLLQRFSAFVAEWGGDHAELGQAFGAAIGALRDDLSRQPGPSDPEIDRRLDAYIAEHCADDPDRCFLAEGKRRMLESDPELLRLASDYAADVIEERTLAPKLLALIEAQSSDDPPWRENELRRFRDRLRSLGFEIVDVPYLNAPRQAEQWSGVSYVNLLAVERRLFVPMLGLGAYEQRLISRLRARLPRDYEVVPVWARAGLTYGGGVHCVFGVVRRRGADAGS